MQITDEDVDYIISRYLEQRKLKFTQLQEFGDFTRFQHVERYLRNERD